MFRRSEKDDAHEFKPALAEIEERPASPLGRSVFWIVVAVMVFFALWMWAGKMDVVVTARGTVVPEGNIKTLQPLDTGVVRGIFCKEGDLVRKGQVLMEIDPSTTAPELESKTKTLEILELEKQRLDSTAERKGFIPRERGSDREALATQVRIHESAIQAVEKQLSAKRDELRGLVEETRSVEKEMVYNRRLLELAEKREKRLAAVADIIPRSDYEKALNETASYGNNIDQLTLKLVQLEHQKNKVLNEIEYVTSLFKVNTLKEYADIIKQMTEIRADLDKTIFRKEKQTISSPVDGHVANLYVHTVGGVVTPAQKLATVVPAGAPLVIKALVLNKDIGFVGEGMEASVKVDAFDFQKYGILTGAVRNVSKHSLEDEKLGPVYEVYIGLKEIHLMVEGRKAAISSGMSLTAEIKVGKRRVIEFFIYPLIKYLDEGMKVR